MTDFKQHLKVIRLADMGQGVVEVDLGPTTDSLNFEPGQPMSVIVRFTVDEESAPRFGDRFEVRGNLNVGFVEIRPTK